MRLADDALDRLRLAADVPDLEGTPYRFVARLGRGGMGVVFRVHDPRLGRDVALKVLDLGPVGGEEDVRLLREARILAGLEHPGIVPVHDVGRLADGRAFYVMKLVEGERLDRHAAALTGVNERLRLFLRLCEPVAFAHRRGVIHRDLKPENVMVGPFGEVLVLDWGVARLPGGAIEPSAPGSAAGEGTATAAGSALGTPGFMPPEQARGDAALADPRSDVFALGRVLALLAGTPPPAPIRSIVARATAESPADRYLDALALAADVERFLDGEPVGAHVESPFERGARFLRRYQAAVVLVAAYLLLRVLLVLLLR